MKTLLAFVCITVVLVCGAPSTQKRRKREAYSLPDGADILVGSVRTSFNCFGDGYYADVDNNCQIFHVCHSYENMDGSVEQMHWSFLCGNQTVFNQHTMTCTTEDESIPCSESSSFFYLNDRLRSDDPTTYFLEEDDMLRAAPLYRNSLDYQSARVPARAPAPPPPPPSAPPARVPARIPARGRYQG